MSKWQSPADWLDWKLRVKAGVASYLYALLQRIVRDGYLDQDAIVSLCEEEMVEDGYYNNEPILRVDTREQRRSH